MRRALPCLALALCTGFTWPGRLHRLEYDLGHGDAVRRRDVVRQLGGLPGTAAHDALLSALEDADPTVRLVAADVAGRVRLADAVPILRDWLDDKEPATRSAAASALAAIGDPRTRDALVRGLGDAVAEVRRAAVRAVAALGDREAVPSLLDRLDDADVPVREAAVDAVGRLTDGRAVVPLGGRARDDAPEVREAVMRALGRLGDPRALAVLEQGLTDGNADVRLAAAGALGRLGDGGAVRELARVLRGADARVARAAVSALGNISDPRATDALVAVLDEEQVRDAARDALVAQARRAARLAASANTGAASVTAGPATGGADAASAPPGNRVVAALAHALAESRSPTATDAVTGALRRIAAFVPIADAAPALAAKLASGQASEDVVLALGASGSPDAIIPLLERVGERDGPALDVVLDALAAYFERAAVDGRAADPLLDALARAAPERKVKLVRLLGRVRAQRTLPALRAVFGSERADLRRAAIDAVTRIGDPIAVPAFLELLRSTDGETRALAARALAAMADVGATGTLLDLLRGREAIDRDAVMRALGSALARLDAKRSLPPSLKARAFAVLARTGAGADSPLADAALRALAVWHPPQALDAIAALLREPSSRRRALAASALAALPGSSTRGLLRYLLQHDAPVVVAAAASSLGEVGDQRDVAALAKAAQHMHWPVPAAVTWAISRMAERGILKEHATERLLCDLGRARDPYVRANVATAMDAWGAAPCPDGGPDPLAWLARARAPVVRVAAARWARGAAAAGRLDDDAVGAALDACAATDVDPQVREVCTADAPPRFESTSDPDLRAYTSDGARPLRDGLVAVRFANGGVFVGATDANAGLPLFGVIREVVGLEDPDAASLEPAPAATPTRAAVPRIDGAPETP